MNTDIHSEPIVFCHGLLGWGDDGLGKVWPYFVCAERLHRKEKESLPPFVYPSTGPISSLHDQACELFYQIKGGTTNYGTDHSRENRHLQTSRTYSQSDALYAKWDTGHPLDFVAHSMGGPVVRMLQNLLSEDYFYKQCGYTGHTDAAWVRSLTTVAGVHNGSTLTWLLGADEDTGLLRDSAYMIRHLAGLLARYAKIAKRHTALEDFYDLHLDQWGCEASFSSPGELFRRVAPRFVNGMDWAMYDLTPNAMSKHNTHLKEFSCTHYYSYVTGSTLPFVFGMQIPLVLATHWFLIPFSMGMGWYKTDHVWHRNDGMCPSYSMDAPHEGRTVAKVLSPKERQPQNSAALDGGIWHVVRNFHAEDHPEPAMMPHLLRIKSGMRLYREIVDRILFLRKGK